MTCDFTLAATSIGSTRLTRMIREDVHQEFVAALLEQVDHCVVQGVLVLLQPTGDIVGYLNSLSQIDYINSGAILRCRRNGRWRSEQLVGQALVVWASRSWEICPSGWCSISPQRSCQWPWGT